MAEDEEIGIDDKFYKLAISWDEHAEAYYRTIENLENQLDHARRMSEIYRNAAKTMRNIGDGARISIDEHDNFLKRHQAQPAEPAQNPYR